MELYAGNPKTFVGVYLLDMKSGSDSYRTNSIKGIMKRGKAKGILAIAHESSPNVIGSEVTHDLGALKLCSALIVANRWSSDIVDVMDKVDIRYLFGRDN